MNLQKLALLALLPAAILVGAEPADDFYLVRLLAGRAEAAAGRHADAVDDFRIAAFGFLDQPALLSEGLARLALSQAALDREEDTDRTLRRFVEIERRFRGWSRADLDSATRAAFTALVTKRLGAEAARVLDAPPPAPAPAAPAAPAPAPAAASPAATPATALVEAPALPALAGPPAPAASPAPSAAAVAAVLAESKSLVGQGRYVENLRKLVAAVAADPKDRDLRKALLEAACLTKDWPTAVAQLGPLRPLRDGEEPWMFYAAVALHETGGAAESRELAEKALPRLNRSPFVDYYARRILEPTPKR